ncbi:hypothetical protein BUALT_Bualt04G0134900 [Buddleja alternifolia]|uniref:TOD1/MUCI70 glycosyltransferase-like domain-containing protein n=1 Tax=Buddleja alternifolia TaxID=168488 RepID=A0AAV6XWW4_9LAMI|nr:hypothetical protein BUALT_Bualt04G0134900 [Buddleja alternifolia]
MEDLSSADFANCCFASRKNNQDYRMKSIRKRSYIQLFVIICMLLIPAALLFQLWSCQSPEHLFSGVCIGRNKELTFSSTKRSMPKPKHRCSIPLADDPNRVLIPTRRTTDDIVEHLEYMMEDALVVKNGSQTASLFGGHQSWQQREDSFKLNSRMKVHCGFMRNGGAEISIADRKYVEKCRFLVVSAIFGEYDVPHQPSQISVHSKKLFCFLMIVDENSVRFLNQNATTKEDGDGGSWVGIWRLILLKHLPYDEPRRNGKIPKILIHRLFPHAQYSIWIDAKMTLIVDPLLILERYLWREGHTFAIPQHKFHHSIYEEADANKRRKRYCRPLIDVQMKIYRYEGLEPWSPTKTTISDVPEGAIIIREHTKLNNLFSCLWFNEVNLFTPRDQLSFGYVVYRMRGIFKFFMFPNCEFNSLALLHSHTREHSSPIENGTGCDNELDGSISKWKETRGGLGLWTPYPGNLDQVVLPPIVRTFREG